jgi:methylmalonyl-CoA mutase
MSFSTITHSEWIEKVRLELKGEDPAQLHKKKLSGLPVKTLYTEDDVGSGKGHVVRDSRGWKRRQRITNLSVVDANKQMLVDLKGGIDDVWIHVRNVFNSSLDGIEIHDLSDWEELFCGVHTELIRLQLSAEDITTFVPLIKPELEKNSSQYHIDWQWDPIADMAKNGLYYEDMVVRTKEHLLWSNDCSATWKPLCIDLREYHLAGATDIHELALMLATMAEYQRWFPTMNVRQLSEQCWIQLSIGRNIFENVAKFRAARKLWQGMGRVFEQESLNCTVRAVTSERMLTYYDPWVNILRTVTSCTAGIWGGADSITNLSYDFVCAERGERGSRISRNIHAVLDEESHLGHIHDPLAGSYFIENLTEEYCQQAWQMFQDIERQGGICKVISAGGLFSELNRCLTQRQQQIETRKIAITGVTEFADPKDKDADEHEIESLMASSLSESKIRQIQEVEQDNRPIVTIFPGIRRVRDVALLETMRASSGGLFTQKKAFIATIGSEAKWKARATFAENFFGIMGFEVDVYPGVSSQKDEEKLFAAFRNSKCEVSCICGTDDSYEEHLDWMAKILSSKRATVLVAGKKDSPFVDANIFYGVNIREIWTSIFESVHGEEE